jgi:lysophospholipase L1-like esterase
MTDAIGKNFGRQLLRWIVLVLVLAPVVLAGIAAFFRIRSDVPGWVYWKIGLIFLITTELAYIAAFAVAIPCAFVSGVSLVRGRGERNRRPAIARWFVLCLSILFAPLLAEAASLLWRRGPHQDRVMPVGGLRDRVHPDPTTRVALPPAEVKLPTEFPDPPGDRDLDLVVVGESSAEGVPYQYWLSIGHIVQWQLGDIFPDRRIRLQVCAKSGATLEEQHHSLASLERRPDLLIVYCGHNEFQSRFRALRDLHYYLDDQVPGWRETLIDRVEQLSPFCGLIREASEKCRIGIPPSDEGQRRLIDVPAYTAREFSILRDDFRRRLEAIASYAEGVGAVPVLILPPANDAGFEPNRSFLPAATPRRERQALAAEFLAIRASESADPRRCISRYRAILAGNPGFAEGRYRLARLLLEAGDFQEAYEHFVASRDLDGYPIRAPSAFQEAYREVARRHGRILIDGQSLFHAIGRQGMLDDSLFHDAMHPSLRGHIALAEAVLEALQARRAFGWPDRVAPPVVDPARCATHFGIDRKTCEHIGIWVRGFYGLMAPLRYDPRARERLRDLAVKALAEIEAGVAVERLSLPNLGIPDRVPLIPASTPGAAGRAHRDAP